MGKASKWIKNFLTGKKSSSHQPTSVDACRNPKTPISDSIASSKDKRRWSFRKPATTEAYQELNVVDTIANLKSTLEAENQQNRHALTVPVATATPVDPAVAAAAQTVNVAVMNLTYSAPRIAASVEETAATKIQSVFRSYLARKALFALKGLVKLQALVRGHLVRKQATATFRCLQALLTAQARARARRIKMIDGPNPYNPEDDHIKIVEMDIGVPRGSTKSMISYFNNKQTDRRNSCYQHQYSKQHHQHISPAPSAIINISPKSYSGHFNESFYNTTHTSPRYNPSFDKHDPSKVHFLYKPENERCTEYQFFPNYMANTKSSKAKFRSHSAPKQRPVDTFQRQASKRRGSMEGRNVPRAVQIERSSSLICSTPQNCQYPWSEFDESAISIKDSECGSNSTFLTNFHYRRF